MFYKNKQEQRMAHWNDIHKKKYQNIFTNYYHRRLTEIFRNHISVGKKVLEIGCGSGNLLASLEPSIGVGIDFSSEAIIQAKQNHPELIFLCNDALRTDEINITETFDYIIFSDMINDLRDIQSVLSNINKYCNNKTKIIINFYSRLWQPILILAQLLRMAKPLLQQNWLTKHDLENLLYLSDFQTIKYWQEILFPVPIPLLSDFANKFLVKIFPFNIFALSNFMIARPIRYVEGQNYSVSVIVPARNEAGNIEDILTRIPEMGRGTEIIFVEGNSTDNTYEAIKEKLLKFPNKNVHLLQQDGKGKGDAVRKGFSMASGDILMILDADLTVPPEDLPRFYDALAENKGEFINGVRLVYPMEKDAMRLFNFLGNKFFSYAFSFVLGQSIKDTLCGTKVIFKTDYDLIVKNRSYFGDFDPFGDFDLLFGAARLGLKIVDLPIHYQERTYGTTNIQRWKHGWLLLKMVSFAAFRIKFL